VASFVVIGIAAADVKVIANGRHLALRGFGSGSVIIRDW
jgi:hypothetical protein